MMETQLINCFLQSRDPEKPLFSGRQDPERGLVWECNLDGYAIIPVEVFDALRAKAGEVS